MGGLKDSECVDLGWARLGVGGFLKILLEYS